VVLQYYDWRHLKQAFWVLVQESNMNEHPEVSAHNGFKTVPTPQDRIGPGRESTSDVNVHKTK
jgi:hypothetical protein